MQLTLQQLFQKQLQVTNVNFLASLEQLSAIITTQVEHLHLDVTYNSNKSDHEMK